MVNNFDIYKIKMMKLSLIKYINKIKIKIKLNFNVHSNMNNLNNYLSLYKMMIYYFMINYSNISKIFKLLHRLIFK
jgi:hypothetical protein